MGKFNALSYHKVPKIASGHVYIYGLYTTVDNIPDVSNTHHFAIGIPPEVVVADDE